MVHWAKQNTIRIATRIEFQKRGSPHVHSFIEKTIYAQLPDHLSNPELFELVKT